MKAIKLLPLVLLFLVASCSSVRVTSDYDSTTDFSKYKTFAFYKKGFTKSESPDVLVNIFTKSRQKVDVYENNHFYMGWHPWYYGPNFGMQISKYTEGTLFVDLIDAQKKELAWQGIGSGGLTTSGNVAKKEERIKEFVAQIMENYPPVLE